MSVLHLSFHDNPGKCSCISRAGGSVKIQVLPTMHNKAGPAQTGSFRDYRDCQFGKAYLPTKYYI